MSKMKKKILALYGKASLELKVSSNSAACTYIAFPLLITTQKGCVLPMGLRGEQAEPEIGLKIHKGELMSQHTHTISLGIEDNIAM